MTPAVISDSCKDHHLNGNISFERCIKEADSRRKKKQWLKLGIACTLIAIGFFTLVGGLLMNTLIIPLVVESNINDNSRLIDNSVLMQKWTKPEYKMQFKIYVYSIKNPDEFMTGSKPEMVVSGPYTFDKKVENKVLSSGYGKVKYRKYETFHFNEKDSCQTCILGNRIWVPNMVYQKFVEASSTTGMRAAATTLLSQTAFLEVEVNELLFEGYKDPFMDKVCEIPFMNFVCESILDLPDRIGLFYEANNTGSKIYEIWDGTDDPQTLGKLVSYDGEKLLNENWWSTEEARQLKGTDGSLFPPFLKKDEKLWIFVKELCRSIWLEFKEEVDVKGVKAYRFVVSPNVFDPEYQGNDGFCNPTDKDFFSSQNVTECWPKGLLEISKCERSQPPIMVSLPNFLFSTDEVKNSVKGLNASDENNDGIFVDIEPRLGAVLQAKKRSQVNIEMWKGKDIAFPVDLKKMKSTLIPVIAVHEEIEADDNSIQMMKTELYETENRAYSIATVMSIIGGCLLAIGVLLLCLAVGCWRKCTGKRTVSPLPPYVPKNAQRT